MAKEIKWGHLTPTERQTLKELEASKVAICAAPMEVESDEQLHDLGLTWDDVKTWHYGVTKVPVRPTPSDPATAETLQHDLQEKHCHNWRKSRCDIPGKIKPTIKCPENNKCSNCPYPEYRDRQKPNQLSLEGLKESGWEMPAHDDGIRKVEIRITLDDVSAVIKARNPKYLQAIRLRVDDGHPVSEIAVMMGVSESTVNYYISKAVEIGKAYKEKYRITLD